MNVACLRAPRRQAALRIPLVIFWWPLSRPLHAQVWRPAAGLERGSGGPEQSPPSRARWRGRRGNVYERTRPTATGVGVVVVEGRRVTGSVGAVGLRGPAEVTRRLPFISWLGFPHGNRRVTTAGPRKPT